MQDPLLPAKLRQAKEKTNNDSKADERGKRRAEAIKLIKKSHFNFFSHVF